MDMRLLDIRNINCWIVNLKPGGLERKELEKLQESCRLKCIFGIGWPLPDFSSTKLKLTKDIKDIYKEKKNDISENALENISRVKKGDIMIMRNLNGHYYVSRVIEEAFYDPDLFNSVLSWKVRVDDWYEYALESDLPMEVCGRFSQRNQSTISRIDNYRLRLLIILSYEKKSNKPIVGENGVPKIKLTRDNFVRSLNYMELENLVCKYISDENKKGNYIMLPSSSKISHPKYEFIFVSNSMKPITCQVKNQAEININDYIDDKDIYEKIYLFSGQKNNDKKNLLPNIEIIDSDDLYNTLLGFTYLKNKLSQYYSISDGTNFDEDWGKTFSGMEIELKKNGWQNKKRYQKDRFIYKAYAGNDVNTNAQNVENNKENDNEEEKSISKWRGVEFYYDIFYSEDFDGIIVAYENDRTNEIIENLKKIFKLS